MPEQLTNDDLVRLEELCEKATAEERETRTAYPAVRAFTREMYVALPSALATIRALQNRVVELERATPADADAAELIDDMFRQTAIYQDVGEMDGWWDAMSLSSVMGAGDWLVKHAGWKRHPNGVGRRWFYRPPPEYQDCGHPVSAIALGKEDTNHCGMCKAEAANREVK